MVSVQRETLSIGMAFLACIALSGMAPSDDVGSTPTCFQTDIPEAPEPFVLSNDAVYLESSWVLPVTEPAAPGVQEWTHVGRTEGRRVLAGREGSLVSDVFVASGMELTRDYWIGADQTSVAMRMKLRNRGSADIRLEALTPFRCEEPGSMVLGGAGAGGWEMLIQQRLKNGHPRALKPEAGDPLEIDSFCLVHKAGTGQDPVLLAGYVSQLGHLARVMVEFAEGSDGVELVHFTAECEFDGVVVPPGGERTSQWFQLQLGRDPAEVVANFADRMGRYAGVKPPPPTAPSVWCSWYYYGPHFTEEYFLEDVAAMEAGKLPFDVILIDDCWSPHWGDWFSNEKWSSGMKAAADRIRSAGYRPGIWTCPYLAEENSQLAAEHPEWLLRLADGSLCVFKMGGYINYVLDPTYPGVCDFLEETYRRLTDDWGFTYHKYDFMRSVFVNKDVVFYDPSATRLEAYRMGLEAIRRATGPDAYISVCGGHYGGSLGLADSQRSGSDVKSIWKDHIIPRIRQNILRTWMSRLWHVDPDAMMVRRRDEPINDTRHGMLSLGQFTDAEAKTVALNQYIGGNMVCFTERFGEIDADRLALYRHIVPSVNSASIPLDIFSIPCPSQLLTRVAPRCAELGPWVTVAVVNWTDEAQAATVVLSDKVLATVPGSRYLVSEFFTQEILGLFEPGAAIGLGTQAPHTSRLLRIAPWDGTGPVLAGTDLHFSGGGVEIARWQTRAGEASGAVDTGWRYPVRVTVAFPKGAGYVANTVVVEPDQRTFRVETPN